ncbi:MAG: family 78 glycoside hydrolase catalytic domain [Lentisphaeria bacterium]|nr:family 78 glycoside hydrolase catalytic domain [Lentisphaeria bacterium]
MNEKIRQHEFNGSWLWLSREKTQRRESRVFLRKEFSLDSMISFADLWISVVPGYHLYINGCHVGYNRGMASGKSCRLDHYDVAQFLDIGLNTIAIEAHIPAARTTFTSSGEPGFWCQLDLNNTPFLWTNAYWKIREVDFCRNNPPMRHVALGATLQLDLARFPASWQLSGFDDSSWRQPDILREIRGGSAELQDTGFQQLIWDETALESPVLAGLFRAEMPFSCLSYSRLKEFSGGTTAAGTFFFAEEEFDTDLVVSSDDPCIIYGNDVELYRSSNRATEPPVIETSESFKAGESLLQTTAFHVKRGWNKLLVIQDTLPHSMGFFLLFPGQPKDRFIFRCKPEHAAEEGWSLTEPLELPFAFAMPYVELFTEKTKAVCSSAPENINDVSTFLHSCSFYPYSQFRSSPLLDGAEEGNELVRPSAESSTESNILREGEYAVYDLGQLMYGFPCFEFEGSPGDIVDITPGIHFAENRIRSVGPMGRKTDTVILSGMGKSKDVWHRFEPMGARFIMVTVRKAAGKVSLHGSFRFCNADTATDIDFHCSDPLLEEVWNKALLCREQCIKNSIIDNPTGRCCQSLTECFIYARALYSFFGETPPVTNALEQFADAQLPNGMIPAIAPSGVHTFAPDSALCWILWLREHFMAGGDLEFLRSMLGVLKKLLNLFGISSAKNNGLLSTEIFGRTEFLNDSGNMEEQGVFTALNALYCRALLRGEQLFLAAGKPEEAEECRTKASYVASAVQALSFDAEKGLFADNCLHGKRSESFSLEANILALYGGLVPREAQQGILEKLLKAFREEPGRFSNSRILGFVLDTLCACGLQQEALELIRISAEFNRRYENIPTYENLLIFPLTAGNCLIREVLGLRPASPDRKQLYFNPACRCVRHAKGKVTGGSQQILVEWELDEKEELTVYLDSNFPLDIVPIIPEDVKGCTFKLGTQIHILQPEEKA